MSKILSLLTLVFLAIPAGAAPRAILRETEFDFGRARQGVKVVHTFSLHNGGDSPLTIEKVELSMRGMTCRFPHIVPPGSDAAIAIEWDTSHIQGKLRGQAALDTNDPALSAERLGLSGEIIGLFEFAPLPEVFLSEFVGEEKSTDLELTVNAERPIEVRLIGQGSKIDAILSPIKAGRSYRISVRAASGAAPGRFDDLLRFSTDDPAHPRISVPVHLFVKPDLYANPDDIDFGEVPLRQLREQPGTAHLLEQVVFVKKREGRFRLTKVHSDLPALDLAIDPSGESSTFQIRARLRVEALRAGSLEGTISAETDDPRFPHVLIRVHGRVT